MTSCSKPNTEIHECLRVARKNISTWSPGIFDEELWTPRRSAFMALFKDPDAAMDLMQSLLETATPRNPLPQHMQNVEAPGGCWELGTQIQPHKTNIKAPDGRSFTVHTYRLVYILHSGILLNETDHVRHMCNNRACIRPDHLLDGSAQQNRQDDVRRLYAGNSPKGRGQTLHGHIPKHTQLRPDPYVQEALERGDQTPTSGKPKDNSRA